MEFRMPRRSFLLSSVAAFPLLGIMDAGSPRTEAAEVEVGAVGVPVEIVTRSDTPLIAAARERLTSYLKELTGKSPVLSSHASAGRRLILLGDSSLAEEYGVVPPQTDPESFTVAPVSKKNQSLLIISGRTDQGVKQGVFQVMRTLSLKNGRLVLPGRTIPSSPFIAGRGLHLGGYVRQVFNQKDPNAFGPESRATPEQLAWNHWDRWEVERIPDYLDMLDFFGYNLIESEPGQLRPAKGSSPEEQQKVARRRDAFVGRLRRNGMGHGIHFPGTLDGPQGPVPYGNDTRHSYEEHYRSVAEGVAPYGDWVMTHWLDGGGWKSTPEHPCSIEVLQNLHMQIHRAFKNVNPKLRSILSLWYLDTPGPGSGNLKWDGYTGVDSILKSGLIPSEVGLAMSRTYRPEEARKIIAAGHKASVWGWYLADGELAYTMHVHTHILGDYLRNLPGEARELIDLQTLDSCQAETNIYSLYVGARLLWNPYENPEVYLREVAKLVYGPRLEQPVFRGLKAIADIRCGKRCRGYWRAEYQGRKDFNGVLSFDQALDQGRAAWNGLKHLEIDNSYKPPIRFHRPLETLFRELKGNVQAVATYMEFLRDRQMGKKQPTEVPSAYGPFEFYERMQYLKPGEVYWPATVVR